MREELGMLTRPTTEAGSSPTAYLGSPEPRREVGEGSDERDPPVSGRVRERASLCARGNRMGRLGPRFSGPASPAHCNFLFSFYIKSASCFFV